MSAPAEPGWSAARQGRRGRIGRIDGEGAEAAGGRGRRREFRFTSDDHLAIHRRSIHLWLLGAFLAPLYETTPFGCRFGCCLAPPSWRGPVRAHWPRVIAFPCPLGRSAVPNRSTCLAVLYTFTIFCQVVIIKS